MLAIHHLFDWKEIPKLAPEKMNRVEQTKTKPLTCPVPHKQRGPWMRFIKRVGIAGFLFFLIKGLLWLIIPYLIAKGLFN